MAARGGDLKAHLAKAKEVVAQTMKNECAQVLFNEPVDPEALGIPDYFDIVKSPMDLGTVHKKLGASVYNHPDEVRGDVDLIWANCYAFNSRPEDQGIRDMCDQVREEFERRWTRAKLNIAPELEQLQQPGTAAENDIPPRFSRKPAGCALPVRLIDNFKLVSATDPDAVVELEGLDPASSTAILVGTLRPWDGDGASSTSYEVTTGPVLDYCLQAGQQDAGFWAITESAWYKLLRPSGAYDAPFAALSRQAHMVTAAIGALQQQPSADLASVFPDLHSTLSRGASLLASAPDRSAAAKDLPPEIVELTQGSGLQLLGTLQGWWQAHKGGRGSRPPPVLLQELELLLGACGASLPQAAAGGKAAAGNASGSGGRRRSSTGRGSGGPGAPASGGKGVRRQKAKRPEVEPEAGLDGDSMDLDVAEAEMADDQDLAEEGDATGYGRCEDSLARKRAYEHNRRKRQRVMEEQARLEREAAADQERGMPPSSRDNFRLSGSLLGDLLMIWDCLQTFGALLQIPPFPLWRLEAALCPGPFSKGEIPIGTAADAPPDSLAPYHRPRVPEPGPDDRSPQIAASSSGAAAPVSESASDPAQGGGGSTADSSGGATAAAAAGNGATENGSTPGLSAPPSATGGASSSAEVDTSSAEGGPQKRPREGRDDEEGEDEDEDFDPDDEGRSGPAEREEGDEDGDYDPAKAGSKPVRRRGRPPKQVHFVGMAGDGASRELLLVDGATEAAGVLLRDVHLMLVQAARGKTPGRSNRKGQLLEQPKASKLMLPDNIPALHWTQQVADVVLAAPSETIDPDAQTAASKLLAGEYTDLSMRERLCMLRALVHLALCAEPMRNLVNRRIDELAPGSKANNAARSVVAKRAADSYTPDDWVQWVESCGIGVRTPLGEDSRGRQYWVLGGRAGSWQLFVEDLRRLHLGEPHWSWYDASGIQELVVWLRKGGLAAETAILQHLEKVPLPLPQGPRTVPNGSTGSAGDQPAPSFDHAESRRPDGYRSLPPAPELRGELSYEGVSLCSGSEERLEACLHSLLSLVTFWRRPTPFISALGSLLAALPTARNAQDTASFVVQAEKLLHEAGLTKPVWNEQWRVQWRRSLLGAKDLRSVLLHTSHMQRYVSIPWLVSHRTGFMELHNIAKCPLWMPQRGDRVYLIRNGLQEHVDRFLELMEHWKVLFIKDTSNNPVLNMDVLRVKRVQYQQALEEAEERRRRDRGGGALRDAEVIKEEGKEEDGGGEVLRYVSNGLPLSWGLSPARHDFLSPGLKQQRAKPGTNSAQREIHPALHWMAKSTDEDPDSKEPAQGIRDDTSDMHLEDWIMTQDTLQEYIAQNELWEQELKNVREQLKQLDAVELFRVIAIHYHTGDGYTEGIKAGTIFNPWHGGLMRPPMAWIVLQHQAAGSKPQFQQSGYRLPYIAVPIHITNALPAFLVPEQQYVDAIKHNWQAGDRFRMLFGVKSSGQQYYRGTILDVTSAPKTPGFDPWESMVVRWDVEGAGEHTAVPRISPWEIEDDPEELKRQQQAHRREIEAQQRAARAARASNARLEAVMEEWGDVLDTSAVAELGTRSGRAASAKAMAVVAADEEEPELSDEEVRPVGRGQRRSRLRFSAPAEPGGSSEDTQDDPLTGANPSPGTRHAQPEVRSAPRRGADTMGEETEEDEDLGPADSEERLLASARGSGSGGSAAPPPAIPEAILQGLPPRDAFVNMVANFCLTVAGSKFKVPVFSTTPLDLRRVFLEVQDRGGYDVVTACKHWKEVCRALGVVLKGQTSASYNMRINYEKCLRDFEDYVRNGGYAADLRDGTLPPSDMQFPSPAAARMAVRQGGRLPLYARLADARAGGARGQDWVAQALQGDTGGSSCSRVRASVTVPPSGRAWLRMVAPTLPGETPQPCGAAVGHEAAAAGGGALSALTPAQRGAWIDSCLLASGVTAVSEPGVVVPTAADASAADPAL